jgi:N-acetylneuraminic acid mutarotase
MNIGRFYHTASTLTNGKVLVTGGYNGNGLNSAELYDSLTGTWTLTNNMSFVRYVHTASILTNGQVLVSGGYNGSTVRSSAELY